MLTLELSSIVLEIPNDVHDRMRILQNSQNKMFSNENSDIAISLRNFIAQPMIFFSYFCDQN